MWRQLQVYIDEAYEAMQNKDPLSWDTDFDEVTVIQPEEFSQIGCCPRMTHVPHPIQVCAHFEPVQ